MSLSSISTKTRILVVDSHPITRAGFSHLFGTQPDMELCGETDGLAEAMNLYFDNPADIVMSDIRLENGSGLELTQELLAINPQIRVLICSAYDDSMYAERALKAGARGYINKQETAEHLLLALRRVREGKIFLSTEMTERVLSRSVGNENEIQCSPIDKLTDRELQVFEEIGHGVTTRKIAAKLHLSPKTIETYRENIKSKLGLKNATELTQHSIRWVLEREQLV